MSETTDRAALIEYAAVFFRDSDPVSLLGLDLAAALEQAERELAAARSMTERATETLARIASLDISATKSIEDLVAPWRRLNA